MIGPVHFLFWCVQFVVLTAQTSSLLSALGLQNEMLTRIRVLYSMKQALAADCQGGSTKQGSACAPAPSLP